MYVFWLIRDICCISTYHVIDVPRIKELLSIYQRINLFNLWKKCLYEIRPTCTHYWYVILKSSYCTHRLSDLCSPSVPFLSWLIKVTFGNYGEGNRSKNNLVRWMFYFMEIPVPIFKQNNFQSLRWDYFNPFNRWQ